MSKNRINIVEEDIYRRAEYNSRRHFLKNCTYGLGELALGSLMGCGKLFFGNKDAGKAAVFQQGIPHFATKVKSDICLTLDGGTCTHILLHVQPKMENNHDRLNRQ